MCICIFLYALCIFLDFFHIKLIDQWVGGASGAPPLINYRFYTKKQHIYTKAYKTYANTHKAYRIYKNR